MQPNKNRVNEVPISSNIIPAIIAPGVVHKRTRVGVNE